MTTQAQHDMVIDLAKHLDQRIDTALDDFFNRSVDIVGAEQDLVRAVAITALGRQLTALAQAADASEIEFVQLCRWHFHNAQQAVGR